MRLLLLGGLLASGEDGVFAVGACEQNGERDGDYHEEYRAPGGELGKKIGGATRAECRLRTLAAECTGEVGGLALLQENDADQEQTDDDVNDNKEDDHRDCFGTSKNWDAAVQRAVRPEYPAESLDWCGGGDLNPYALRR